MVSRIIYWIERGEPLSMKYNDLKQRLMKIWMKNLVYIAVLQFAICTLAVP